MLKFRFLLLFATVASGCAPSASQNAVVVYTALDSEFSEPILQSFTKETGIAAQPVFDAESTKTVGLTQRIIAEARRPRCDVFWNNEILHTLRLEQQGLLDVYRSPAANAFPEIWRSPGGTYHAFAARARILLVNTDLIPQARPGEDSLQRSGRQPNNSPTSIYDLANPKWKGRTAIAKPLFGTTATHAACLFASLGPEAAKKFFHDLQQNDVQILAGNKQVAQAVAAGQCAFGLTDTDDAIIEIEAGRPVAIVYPDQAEGQLGTLFIPNTLAILKNCPHPLRARRLVDYLLQPAVEQRLAEGPSAQIPLNPAVKANLRIGAPQSISPMQVDFQAAAAHWNQAAGFIRDEFATAD
jgi:iron(III) transport system substrate-binding protein